VTQETSGIAGRPITQPRGFDMAASEVRYLDQVTGYGWAVLGVGVTAAHWHEAVSLAESLHGTAVHICADDTLPYAVPEGVSVFVDVDGMIKADFGPLRGHFLLVRPDHVVAAAWRPGGAPAVASAVAEWATTSSSRR
jgi:3-(3-hydroxy-phenyl)propionate hydroxylase